MNDFLYETARVIAILTNPQCHYGLQDLPDIERNVAIKDFKKMMREELDKREIISEAIREAIGDFRGSKLGEFIGNGS